MKRLNKIIYWVACFILTSGLSTYAAEQGGSRLAVRYGDLILSRAEGARTLLTRLDHAATYVCGGRPGSADLPARAAYAACRKREMDRAVAAIHAPLVASIYRANDPARIVVR